MPPQSCYNFFTLSKLQVILVFQSISAKGGVMTVLKFSDEAVSKEIRTRLNLAIDMNDSIPKGHGRTAAVASLLEEGHQTVRLWLADGIERKAGLPNLSRLASITEKLGINTAWLVEGVGPMLRKDTDDKNTVNAEALSEMWQVAQKELPDIDLDAMDNEVRGTVLLHIYELITMYSYKTLPDASPESAKMFKFGVNSVRKLAQMQSKK